MSFLIQAICASSAAASVAPQYDPIADPAAIVVFGGARFTVLTNALVRMEKPLVCGGGYMSFNSDAAATAAAPPSIEVSFEDRPTLSFVNRKLPVPTFSVTHPTKQSVAIETDSFVLTYTAVPPAPVSIPW